MESADTREFVYHLIHIPGVDRRAGKEVLVGAHGPLAFTNIMYGSKVI